MKTMNGCHRNSGTLRLIAAVALGVVFGGLILSSVFWAFALLFHLLFWMFRLAVVVGIVGAIIWGITRWRARDDSAYR